MCFLKHYLVTQNFFSQVDEHPESEEPTGTEI